MCAFTKRVKIAMCHQALFIERQQALLHGDLHTGSFMVTEETTYAIDAEFAYYGPMAFDVCKMIANLLIAFFASDGLATKDSPRQKQRKWLLKVTAAQLLAPMTQTELSQVVQTT